MYTATRTKTCLRASSFKSRLEGIVGQLSELEADLIRSRRSDQAGSLRTIIADLGWQLEEADDIEDGGEGDE